MRIQVIDRAFELIGLIASRGTASLAELSRETGLPISTVARIAGSLASHGILERTAGRKYRLGGRILTLAARVEPIRNLVEAGRSTMLHLAHETGEDVGLSILQGEEAVIVDWMHGRHPIKVIEPFSGSITLNCAFRKLYLAYKSDKWVRDYVLRTTFPQYTPFTITDPKKILDEVRKVRRAGFAISRSENILGAGSVGAPVFDHNGELMATIFVTAPLDRFDSVDLPSLTASVVRAGKTMTAQIRTGGLHNIRSTERN